MNGWIKAAKPLLEKDGFNIRDLSLVGDVAYFSMQDGEGSFRVGSAKTVDGGYSFGDIKVVLKPKRESWFGKSVGQPSALKVDDKLLLVATGRTESDVGLGVFVNDVDYGCKLKLSDFMFDHKHCLASMGVPCLVKLKNGFMMLLEGRKNDEVNRWRIFGAISEDFVGDWIPLNDGYPLFKEHGKTWESVGVANPHLVKVGKEYLMMYNGIGKDCVWRVGLAKWKSLKRWKRNCDSVLVPSLEWDCNGVESSFLVADGLYWRFYFQGWDENYVSRIGLAVCRQTKVKKHSWYRRLFRKSRLGVSVVWKSDLVDELKKLGLVEGDCVMVHCSLSSFGYVVGGAKTVIEALKCVVGTDGVLLMPTFTCPVDDKFDVNDSCNRSMGVVAETFHKKKESIRSLHPTHSVSACGKNAESFVCEHHDCIVPFGEGSPFDQLLKHDGKILLLGVDQNVNSSVHMFEAKQSVFPFDVYLPNLFKFNVKDWNDNVGVVETKLFNPVVARYRDVGKIEKYLVATNVLRSGKVGDADIYVMRIRDLVRVLSNMLERGETIYTVNKN